jgi:hypothetical protein
VNKLRWIGFCLILFVGFGCSGADEGKPNPDLKVPEIKPGRGAEDAPIDKSRSGQKK